MSNKQPPPEPISRQPYQSPNQFWLLTRLPWIKEAGADDNPQAITTSQVSQAWVFAAGGMVLLGALLGNGPLFALGLFLGAALLVAWLWARYCLRNLTVQRRFSQPRAFYGEEITMSQVFTNNKPLPVPWLAVHDEYPGALEISSAAASASSKARVRTLVTTLSLGWYERVTRHYNVRCTARGEHTLGPVDLESGDVFGLFRRTQELATPQTLIVYPRYVPIEQLGITARQPFGDFKATQNLATDPLRLRTIREYAYGDNPRHIHWKASARRGQLQTKLFEPAATPQLFIYCNQDTFARIWEGLDPQSLELTITVAASLANYGLEEGYMVGLRVNSFSPHSDMQVKINPSRNPEQFTRILEALARVRGWSGAPMEELLEAERRNLPRGATLVVVTAVISDDMLNVLTAIRRAGHPVTLVDTVGSRRTVSQREVSSEALRSYGIDYYRIEAIGQAASIEKLTF
ncbi:MAG: hypothetical protein QOH93_2617 [Chloroflexia bacterium]|jgi:uncharacterized protein (DUF58 family)|nr:hypothetical protein [Chloroflexia bacterium]